MMVEVTDEDREAAASVAVLAEMRELILSGRADHHAEPWAIHRQRGKLEGARLALEAAAKSARDYSAKARLRCWATHPDSASVAGQHIATNIRALDPSTIVKETSDGL